MKLYLGSTVKLDGYKIHLSVSHTDVVQEQYSYIVCLKRFITNINTCVSLRLTSIGNYIKMLAISIKDQNIQDSCMTSTYRQTCFLANQYKREKYVTVVSPCIVELRQDC